MSGPTIKSARGRCASLKSSTRFQPLYNRPVSDLKVTYIIFPGTAEKPFGPPDLERIHARCETLVKEIGGASVPLHRWENIIPSPTPSPTPSLSVTPSPSSTGSATPSPSPAPTFAFPVSSPLAGTPASSPAATRSPHRRHKA